MFTVQIYISGRWMDTKNHGYNLEEAIDIAQGFGKYGISSRVIDERENVVWPEPKWP